MHHHNSRPPACATTVTGHPRRLTGAANTRPSSGKETPATGASTTRTGGGDNLHRRSGADRTRRRGLAGPRRPGRAHLDPNNPVAMLQLADQRSSHRPRPPPPCHHQETTPRNTEPPAHLNQDGAQMGPNLGWAGAASHQRHHAAPRPTAAPPRQAPPRHAASPPTGHTDADRGAPPPHHRLSMGWRARGRAYPPPLAPRGRGPAALAGGCGRKEERRGSLEGRRGGPPDRLARGGDAGGTGGARPPFFSNAITSKL